MGLISRVSSRTYRNIMSFSHKQVRSMISMMTKGQRRDFTISIYRDIIRQTYKLQHTDQLWLRTKINYHFLENSKKKNNTDQIKAIERAAYFMRSNLGGFI